jgi:hypothetical protein
MRGLSGNGVGHLFLALGCHTPPAPTDHADDPDLEEQRHLLLTLDELETAVLDGQFKVHSWSATVAMALLFIRRRACARVQISAHAEFERLGLAVGQPIDCDSARGSTGGAAAVEPSQ